MLDRDVHFLRMAARLALRGHGGAEPNPLVGCVIVSPSGETVGWGYHRQFGGPHAEVVALQRADRRTRGATLYCTLEPCSHTGQTGPCTRAIIDAGIAKVIIARRDPNPIAAGGLERLRAAGITVELNERCEAAIAVSDSFVHRVRTGLPWVTVKWAQTIDGKIATHTGESKWISNEASRKMVHRERGRVDAILTGIGTVLKDDPMLTARGVRVRRLARRVVIDPLLQTPLNAKIVTTLQQAPTTIVCDRRLIDANDDRIKHFRSVGVDLIGVGLNASELPLATALRELSLRYQTATVLVEAGTRLMSRLFQQKLANEAWVFIAPMLLGDEQAKHAVTGMMASHLNDGAQLEVQSIRQRRGDVILRYRAK